MDSKTFINNITQILDEDTVHVISLIEAFAATLCSCATTMTVVAVPSFGSFVPTKADEEIITDRSTGRRLLLPPQITVEFHAAAKLRKSVMPQCSVAGTDRSETSGTETINLPKLINMLSESANCPPATTRKFLHEFFAFIESRLSEGDTISISGVGDFIVTDNPSNPIKYLVDKTLADIANEPFAAFEAVEIGDGISDEELADNISVILPKAGPIIVENKEEIEAWPESESEAEEIEEVDDATTINDAAVEESIKEEDLSVNPEENVYYEADDEVENIENSQSKWLYMVIGLLIGLIIGLVGGFFAGKEMVNPNGINKIMEETNSLNSVDTIAEEKSEIAEPVQETIVEPELQPIYDVVRSKRYLTTMAREHYGNYKYWVFIYDANPKLGNPNQISIGTKILIPDQKTFMEDSEEKTLEKAQRLLDKINQKYKI